MIAPKKIFWNGYNSIEMSCRTNLAFDSDSGETETYLNKEAVSSDSADGSVRKVHMYRYSDVLNAHITLIKEDFTPFTRDENRIMLSWLTSKKTSGVLSVYYENEDKPDYELIGNFIEVSQQKLGNGQVTGYTCVFECVSPYAYSTVKTESYNVDESLSFALRCYNDELNSLIYPKITIQTTTGTDVAIVNESVTTIVQTNMGEQKVPITTTIKNNLAGETVIIDGTNKLVYSDRPNRVFGDDFSWTSWMPLTLGANKITVNGPCSISFEWREPRKVGSL